MTIGRIPARGRLLPPSVGLDLDDNPGDEGEPAEIDDRRARFEGRNGCQIHITYRDPRIIANCGYLFEGVELAGRRISRITCDLDSFRALEAVNPEIPALGFDKEVNGGGDVKFQPYPPLKPKSPSGFKLSVIFRGFRGHGQPE